MPGYTGGLPHVVLSQTLWLLVAPLLLGLLGHMALAYQANRSGQAASASHGNARGARAVGLAAIVLAAAATVAHIAALPRGSERAGVLLQVVARGIRVGGVDAAFALSLDPLSAFACALACGVALAAAAPLAWRPAPDSGWRQWAWIELALSGALISFLAEGLATMLLGWALAAAAGAWLAGWVDVQAGIRAATRSAFAMTALLLGAALLFWGLGGTWRGDDYTDDGASSFEAVRALASDEGAPTDGAETLGGFLTMAVRPGTTVYFDDARASAMTSPFVDLPLAAGPHTLHFVSGSLSKDVLVQNEPSAGASWELVFVGPTLSIREMGVLALARDPAGQAVLARELRGRRAPAGLPLVLSVLALWIVAAWAMSGPSPRVHAPRALIAVAYVVTTAMLGPFLLARASFLVAMAPQVRVLVASVGASMLITALGRGLGKATAGRAFRWEPFLTAAPGGVAWMALGMMGGVAAMTTTSRVIVCVGLAASALLLFAARRTAPPADPLSPDLEPVGAQAAIVFEHVSHRLGTLLVSYERWVIDATGRAVVALIRVSAWLLTLTDQHVLDAPADAAATRLVGVSRGFSPMVGGSLAGIAWGALALVATAALALTLWLGR